MSVGAKRNETRGWPVSYRGPLLICESKHLIDDIGREAMRVAAAAGFTIELHPGEAVCVVDLVNCVRITPGMADTASLEYAMGDYTPGRFAWVTRNCRRLRPGFFVTGKQGLFDVPDELITPWVIG
jgi:hypothetical protein